MVFLKEKVSYLENFFLENQSLPSPALFLKTRSLVGTPSLSGSGPLPTIGVAPHYLAPDQEVNTLSDIGRNLRKLRLSQELSLAQLSEMAAISVAQLSKLENNKVEPSVTSLRKLADALRVSLATLVAEEDPPRLNPVLRGEGYTFRRSTNGREPVVEVFLHMSRDAHMQPEIITFPPGTESGQPLTHDGEEFCYVLEGRIRFFYGSQNPVELKDGDFIYFDNTVPHRYANPDADQQTRLLVCCSPPVF